MDIFRPFSRQPEPGQLRSFEASERQGDIDAVYRASVTQLKRLVLIYLTKFEASSYCFLFQTSLLYLFNALVREVKMYGFETRENEEWKFYLRLCLEGMSRLFRSFDVIKHLLKGMLSLAIGAEALDLQAASDIFDTIRQQAADTQNLAQQDKHKEKASSDPEDLPELRDGTFIVDLDLATVDPDAATLGALTAQFDDLTMHSGTSSRAEQHRATFQGQQRSGPSGARQDSDESTPKGVAKNRPDARPDAEYPIWEK